MRAGSHPVRIRGRAGTARGATAHSALPAARSADDDPRGDGGLRRRTSWTATRRWWPSTARRVGNRRPRTDPGPRRRGPRPRICTGTRGVPARRWHGGVAAGDAAPAAHGTGSGLPAPVAQYRVTDDRGRIARDVDFAWPDRRVVVEYDGQWHAEPEQVGSDRRRLNRLLAAGWYGRLRDRGGHAPPGELVARIASALASDAGVHSSTSAGRMRWRSAHRQRTAGPGARARASRCA